MNRAIDRLFTFVNSGVGKFALLILTICAPFQVAHAQMVLFSGSNQAGVVNTALANPLTVRFSANSYVSLDWTVTGGTATFQESGTTTFSSFGQMTVNRGDTFSVHLNLGNSPGPVTVDAHCGGGCDSGIDVLFNETINGHNSIGTPSGGGQSGLPNTTLTTPLMVSFSGVSNATLQWRVTAGTATFQESGSTTYTPLNGATQTANGQTSSVHLVLGSTPGPVTVTATCSSGCDSTPTQTFNATINAPPTNTIAISSGNNQSAPINSTLSSPLTVTFSGAPVGGPSVLLDWQVSSGIATIQESGSAAYSQSLSTSAGSTASIHLTFGPSSGPVAVTATCSAGCTGSTQFVTFNETANPAQSPNPSLQIFNGNNQSGPPGSTLSIPLEVILQPGPGFDGGVFPVTWHVESGTATFAESKSASFTDSVSITSPTQNGDSHVTLVLGATLGDVQVSATCSSCTPSTRLFHASIAPNSTGVLQKISGDNQTGVLGSASDAPLVVQLGNPGSNALSGQPINWAVISGQATLSAATSQTDENGMSQISFTYGSAAGPVTIEATSTNGKVDFTATAFLATQSLVSGNNQIGAVGATLAPFVVQVTSTQVTSAKGLSQVPVQWKITSGSGTLTAATTLTGANGQASNSLTLGNTAGNVTVTATIAGSGAVSSTFTARAISSASIAVFSGDTQSAPSGTALQPFVVQVVSGGLAQPGLNVNWTVLQGGGTLASAVTISDASGHATNTLTLGPNPGVNIVRAQIGGLGSLSFTAFASGTTSGNSQFTIVSGNNQSLTPGQASQPLVVKLLSAQGQPVTGAVVQWAVTGQTGTLTAPNTVTDTSGQSHNTLTTILPGNYAVSAQVAGATGLPTLSFTFGNGVANLPSLTPQQQGVAGVIDKACPALAALPPTSLTPAQQDLLKRCTEIVLAAGNNPNQVPGALGQLTNNKSLPQRQLATTQQLGQFNNLNTRLAELRQGVGGFSAGGLALVNDGQTLPLSALGSLYRKDPQQPDDEVGKDFERWGFFATGMIERGGFSASDMRPGFNFHNDSLTAGVDYRISADLVAGVAVGYNRNDSTLDQNLGKLNADSYSLNGYFTWYRNNDFYVEGSLVVDWLDYDLSRNIAYQIAGATSGTTSVTQSLGASPSGQQTSLSLSLGKDFNRGAWGFSPYLRGIYSHLNLDGFSETADDPNAPGAGLATSVESRSLDTLTGVLGARFNYTTSFDWGVLVPNATVEWNHEFRNNPQTVVVRFLADPTQTPMSITDEASDSNYFNLGLGLNAVLPKGRSAFLLWEHLTGYSGAHENRYSLGIRIEF